MDTNFYGRIVKRMKDQTLVLMCVLYVVWMIKMLDIEMETNPFSWTAKTRSWLYSRRQIQDTKYLTVQRTMLCMVFFAHNRHPFSNGLLPTRERKMSHLYLTGFIHGACVKHNMLVDSAIVRGVYYIFFFIWSDLNFQECKKVSVISERFQLQAAMLFALLIIRGMPWYQDRFNYLHMTILD